MGMLSELFIKLGLKSDEFNRGIDGAQKKTSAFGSAIGKIGGMIAGAFAVGSLISFVRNVVAVRAEFEKYEAVLTNTLGSQQRARQEMQMIQDIAAKTPFSVAELTESFVKLTNYGLKPSRDELIKYGDLASSTGKGFNQLTEAIADATTGQFERLKEFGIKAGKEGDKVTFVFKGQKTVVDNTSKSIKDYILSLGSSVGVTGSMAAISETLGGKISNLGDAWSTMLNTIGKGTSGVFVSVINWVTNLVEGLTMTLKTIRQIKQEVGDKQSATNTEQGIKYVDSLTQNLMGRGKSKGDAQKTALSLYNKETEATELTYLTKLTQVRGQEKVLLNNKLKLLNEEKTAVNDYYNKLGKTVVETTKKNEEADKKAAQEKQNLVDRLILQRIEEQKIISLQGGKIATTDKGIFLEELSGKQGGLLDVPKGQLAGLSESIKSEAPKVLQEVDQFTQELNSIISGGTADAIQSLTQGLSDMAFGNITGGEFGQQILSMVGNFMVQLGMLMITTSTIYKAFVASLASGGWGSLALGVALVAAGSAVSSYAKSGLSSSSGSGSSAASGYSGSQGQSSAANMLQGSVVFELHGNKLQGVLNNTDRRNQNFR